MSPPLDGQRRAMVDISRSSHLYFNNETDGSIGWNMEIRSIKRAAAVLRCFVDKPEGLSLTGIVEITGLSKATVHRILYTLASDDLVRIEGGRYLPGPLLRWRPALIPIATSSASPWSRFQHCETRRERRRPSSFGAACSESPFSSHSLFMS